MGKRRRKACLLKTVEHLETQSAAGTGCLTTPENIKLLSLLINQLNIFSLNGFAHSMSDTVWCACLWEELLSPDLCGLDEQVLQIRITFQFDIKR